MDDSAIIFEEARRLNPAQRVAHLDRACAADSTLRRKIESMLEATEKADAFFGESDHSTEIETTPAVPISEGPSSLIDRCRLLQKIGEEAWESFTWPNKPNPSQAKSPSKSSSSAWAPVSPYF